MLCFMRLRDCRTEKRLTLREAARQLRLGRETYRRYELAPDSVDGRVPDAAAMARIFAWSGGRVRPDGFYALPDPPAGAAAAAQEAE